MNFPNISHIQLIQNPSRWNSIWLALWTVVFSFPEVLFRACAPQLIGIWRVWAVGVKCTLKLLLLMFTNIFTCIFGVLAAGFRGNLSVRTPA